MQTKKNAAFPEKRRLGGIDIFRGLIVLSKQPPAECDHFADIVADWKHDSSAEPVVDVALRFFFVAQFDQPTLQKLAALITALLRPFQEGVPLVGRIADLPILRHRSLDAALFQIIALRFTNIFFQQVLLEPFRGFSMQLQRNASRFMLSIFVDGATLFHDGNPDPRAQFAHRRWKIDMLIIHDEAKDASSYTAAKAVEGLSQRADGK